MAFLLPILFEIGMVGYNKIKGDIDEGKQREEAHRQQLLAFAEQQKQKQIDDATARQFQTGISEVEKQQQAQKAEYLRNQAQNQQQQDLQKRYSQAQQSLASQRSRQSQQSAREAQIIASRAPSKPQRKKLPKISFEKRGRVGGAVNTEALAYIQNYYGISMNDAKKIYKTYF